MIGVKAIHSWYLKIEETARINECKEEGDEVMLGDAVLPKLHAGVHARGPRICCSGPLQMSTARARDRDIFPPCSVQPTFSQRERARCIPSAHMPIDD